MIPPRVYDISYSLSSETAIFSRLEVRCNSGRTPDSAWKLAPCFLDGHALIQEPGPHKAFRFFSHASAQQPWRKSWKKCFKQNFVTASASLYVLKVTECTLGGEEGLVLFAKSFLSLEMLVRIIMGALGVCLH